MRATLRRSEPAVNGNPTTAIDPAAHPAAVWLLCHGFEHQTALNQDLNGDGVSLLMAYALGLDPRLNLSGSLPRPVLCVDSLCISYQATSPGVSYTVEASSDLENWTTSAVTVSEIDPGGQRIASVAIDSDRKFLRLAVSEDIQPNEDERDVIPER